MSGGEAIASLFFLSAGIAFVATLVVIVVNDVLRHFHIGILELESIFSSAFGSFTHPGERAIHGVLALFLGSWGITLGFAIVWQLAWFQRFTGGSMLAALALLTGILYAILSLLAFPLLGHGVAGRKHHVRMPGLTFVLTAAYVVTIGIIFLLLF